jgi:polyhydroxyalkanoate synthase
MLVVPSLINRWYVVDLRRGVSLVGSLVEHGFDTWCLDWGVPRDEDRYLSWEDVLARLARMIRRVKRETGAERIGILGYCMGGTLTGIHTALHPEDIAALVNLVGPFDFAEGGLLARMTDRRWFDADAVADAGNVSPEQMQAGFVALRPTMELAKRVRVATSGNDPAQKEALEALEKWAGDNIPFPAEAYRRYIKDLYQDNQLVHGTHHVGARRVDLGAITCPVLTIAATRDAICPLDAAKALNAHVGSDDTELLVVPGGHVGAVVGRSAPTKLYPAIAEWLAPRLSKPVVGDFFTGETIDVNGGMRL